MKYLVILLVLLTVLVVQKSAWACTCEEMTQERSLEVIENAAFIFEGRIVMLETKEQPTENFNYESALPIKENPLYSKARLKIIGLYKGTPESERLTAYIDTATSCGYYFETSDVSFFVLNRQDGVLVQTDLCNTPLPEHWEDLQTGKFKE